MAEQDSPLVQVLKTASAALDEAQIADDLRPVAFEKAFDFVAGVTQGRSGGHAGAGTSADVGNDAGGDSSLQQIAGKLNLGVDVVSRVYDVDSEGVHLTVSRSALDSTKKAAMQEVIRLIAAGRQALELDEFTPAKLLREACEDRGVLDAGNFAGAMTALDGHGMRIRGTGAARELKLNAAGFEAAAEDVKRVLGEA